MQRGVLFFRDEWNPSIAGTSRKFVCCDPDKNYIDIRGTAEQEYPWAKAAFDRICPIMRNQIFNNVFGKDCTNCSLNAYKNQAEEWSKEKYLQISSGKNLSWSQEKAVIPLGEGLLDFLYADFQKIARTLSADVSDHRYDLQNKKMHNLEDQILYDFLCLSETMSFIKPLITSSIYTSLFPPVMAARTTYHLGRYCNFLESIQNDLLELVQFVFDLEYYPNALGVLSASQRYALYCKLKHADPHYEYQCAFDCKNYELNADIALSLRQMRPQRSCGESEYDAEIQDFCDRYKTTRREIDGYAQLPFYFFSRIQIANIPDMLMFEFFQMLNHHVRLKKCERCGKYFVVKGNYDANYCSRVATGETLTCQELAAQAKYKKKMADNAAIPLYQKYYKRYAARVKAHQIKEPAFKKWKYQAIVKRDECSGGTITLQEFENWMELSFPNRKKKL